MRKHKVAGIITIFLVISLLFSGCTGVVATSIFQATDAETETFPLESESVEFIHLLGVGAWATNLTLSKDGSFYGHYHDTDMGVTGNGHPNGTEYTCDFSGCFQDIRKINDYTYAMTLTSMEADVPGKQWIEDGVLYITEEPAGMAGGKTFYLYTPEAPLDQLPEDLLFWWGLRYWDKDGANLLNVFALYNEESHCGFFPAT